VLPLDRTLVGSLIEESALLERLVADLQDLALADAGMLALHPEERDAADLAEATVAAHRAQADVSGVDLHLTTTPAVVHADPARIRQALGNLVSNAIRHTPPGGTVTVAVGESSDAVTLTVSDTGSGIAGEHLPHIFDRLYRVDPSRSRATGGSGLGLAITKHLVEAHGGRLEVTSTPGTGSTFTIRLDRPQHCICATMAVGFWGGVMELVISIDTGQREPEARSLWDWLVAEPALRGQVRAVEKPDMLTVTLGPDDVAAAVANVLIAWLRRRVGDVTVTITRPDGVWVTVDAEQIRELEPSAVEELVDGLARTLDRPAEDFGSQ
jgi:two-component sensor histidine kinase